MRSRPGLLGALLVALVLTAYIPALRAGFIWDDDRYVTANPALRDLHGLAALWTRLDVAPQFYPLLHTALWMEHALFGLAPRGYHVVSVLFHAGSAILLWRILELLEVPGAWLAAAVFGVHPVHVESVAWISEQKNTLSGLFYLASALAFLAWTEEGHRGRLGPIAAAALFLAALLSKTVTSTLPLALGIVLWWKHGRIGKRELAWLAPMLAAGSALGALTRHLEMTQVGAAGRDWALTFAERGALAGRIVWFYLGKLVWPNPLIFIYPRWALDASPRAWIGTIAVVALAAALWAFRGQIGRGPIAGLAFFVVTLIPALGFFDVYPMRYSFVADHFQYLASIGPIALLSAGAVLGAARLAARRAWARRAAPALAAVVVLALGGRTLARCPAYADQETLWRCTLAANDGAWIAHNDLAILLAEQGKNDEAASHFERVLALRPEHTGALANLGYLQELMGQDGEAAETLARAAAARPGDADARVHLARVLLRLGRRGEAIPPLEEALRLRPSDAEASTLLNQARSFLPPAGVRYPPAPLPAGKAEEKPH